MGQQIFQAIGTIKDAMPVMTTPPTITDRPDASEPRGQHRRNPFRDVCFAYKSGKPVIDDLSLTIRPGEKVGLVGLSGAGKTTLVSLLLRFYDIEDGAILIDGQDIRDRSPRQALRRNIGVIAQDVALLHRSVGDNIRYGRPEATQAGDREVGEDGKAPICSSPISPTAKAERVTTPIVGDRGIRLSGGQRQRVAIARVLLKDAPILVLDEATSALDSESEAAIQEKLNLVMEGKDGDCHRPPPFNHFEHGPDRRARSGPHPGRRQAGRTGRTGWPVCSPVETPDRRLYS